MEPLLSAKGNDITLWRAATDFAAEYRKSLLDLAASDPDGSSESVIEEASATVETLLQAHQTLRQQLHCLIEEMSTALPHRRKELTGAFYGSLYRHFGLFHSATAFYQLSMDFLRTASNAIVAHVISQLGTDARHLPELALIAVGPAGRCEYSPFCPLQILLVHTEVTPEQFPTFNRFCEALHAGFEEGGFPIDPEITPLNPDWRGTLSEWRHRCKTEEESINLCRLIDQFPLCSGSKLGFELKQLSNAALQENIFALTNLVHRMAALSNGLGFMGRLKLERNGLFQLLNHGLMPLSAALSALALIRNNPDSSVYERIHALLKQNKLDVELAERILATWHRLHDLRLWREQSFHIDEHTDHSLSIDPNELTAEQRHALKETLESVAIIQHHVEIIFSGMGE